MRVPFYAIKAQYEELKDQIDAAVGEVLSSGTYAMGPHCAGIERELADLHGVKHGIALNSGTDALHIMLEASEIGAGHEVITTAFTFVASTETVVQTGATPIFVDIDPKTYNIDASAIEAAITPRTRAILPIHLFGQLADVDAITEIADRHALIVLEDAAQAIGCTHNGVGAGNFGLAAGLSFYITKNLGAAGDAGMILTNDDEIAERCRSIRIHGMGRVRYYYDHIGYASRMDEIQAAILRIKLTKLAEWNVRRARIAQIYLARLADTGICLPTVSNGNNCNWHQFPVRVQNREQVMATLKDKGVDTMIYYPVPIHFHDPYKKFGHGPGSLPESERAANEILNLPIHQHLDADQAEYVAESLRVALG